MHFHGVSNRKTTWLLVPAAWLAATFGMPYLIFDESDYISLRAGQHIHITYKPWSFVPSSSAASPSLLSPLIPDSPSQSVWSEYCSDAEAPGKTCNHRKQPLAQAQRSSIKSISVPFKHCIVCGNCILQIIMRLAQSAHTASGHLCILGCVLVVSWSSAHRKILLITLMKYAMFKWNWNQQYHSCALCRCTNVLTVGK